MLRNIFTLKILKVKEELKALFSTLKSTKAYIDIQ